MEFEDERQKKPELQQPSLVEMVDKAVRILQRGDKGFFLFVEGKTSQGQVFFIPS